MPFQGYISSRPFGGTRVPQHIQNAIIRDYCRQYGLQFRLSATELAMPGAYQMFEQLRQELKKLSGVVFYSIDQLPESVARRRKFFDTAISESARIHFAVERFCIFDAASAQRVEDILYLKTILPFCLSTHELCCATGE